MDMVTNNFAELLNEKQIKEKRYIPLAEVAKETGISRRAIYAWENNTITRFDMSVIDALCKYFDIEPGALFRYTKNDVEPTRHKKK